jgi:hypothetical protein
MAIKTPSSPKVPHRVEGPRDGRPGWLAADRRISDAVLVTTGVTGLAALFLVGYALLVRG